MATSRQRRSKSSRKSTFSSAARHANRFPDREIKAEWLTLAASLPCDSWIWYGLAVRDGSCGKTSPESLWQTEDKLSGNSSESLPTAGMAWRGEYLTLDISESPNGAVECSLSDVIEDPRSLERSYLSREQIQKMIVRLERYGQGKSLLAMQLRQALLGGQATKRLSAEDR